MRKSNNMTMEDGNKMENTTGIEMTDKKRK